MPNDSKYIQASLPLILTDWLRLRVARVPRCQDLAIFVVTTDGQTDQLLYPCACAWGNVYLPACVIGYGVVYLP